MQPAVVPLVAWRSFLEQYEPDARYADDGPVWLTCVLALEAVTQGNFGVGAALFDDDGQILAHGHNEVFHPYFRSDLHAEMVVLDRWEDLRLPVQRPRRYTLYTSLEPCPMCLVRLCTSAVDEICHAAPDDVGGMVSRLAMVPPMWSELAALKRFAPARCAPELSQAALAIFTESVPALMAQLKAR
jgi:cytosine deaminase